MSSCLVVSNFDMCMISGSIRLGFGFPLLPSGPLHVKVIAIICQRLGVAVCSCCYWCSACSHASWSQEAPVVIGTMTFKLKGLPRCDPQALGCKLAAWGWPALVARGFKGQASGGGGRV